jgi:hypothetical protein
MYQNGGGVGDPPQGTITPQEALMRALQPENQFRLTGGDAPFRTIREEQDRMAAETVDDSMFEVARFVPGIDVLIDSAELAKVAATGEDFYGEEQDPAMFAGLTAAGYLIPNILEKPLKSAWRAVKKFPAKLPKREFREVPFDQQQAVLQNLTQAHQEVYGDAAGRLVNMPGGSGKFMGKNQMQLSSLMAGSKLENIVAKDGSISVAEAERFLNSPSAGLSASEKDALSNALYKARVQKGTLEGLEPGADLPERVDYNALRRVGSQTSEFSSEAVEEHSLYGLDALGYKDGPQGKTGLFGNPMPPVPEDEVNAKALQEMMPQSVIIRSNAEGLRTVKYPDHWGNTDAIGHYRTFVRPEDKEVLYISEMQSDAMQKKKRSITNEAGEQEIVKDHGLIGDMMRDGNVLSDRQKNLMKNQDEFLISQVLKNEASGYEKLRFPTGETNTKIQYYGQQAGMRDMHLNAVDKAKEDINEILYDDFGYRSNQGLDQIESPFKNILDRQSTIPDGEQGLLDFFKKAEDESGLTYLDIEDSIGQGDFSEVPESIKKLWKDVGESAYEYVESLPPARLEKLKSRYYVEGETKMRLAEALREEFFTEKIGVYRDSVSDRIKNTEFANSYGEQEKVQEAISAGYERLPKALKKHGLDATKVTDDAGNTWWEVDIPARLGEGVGEIRAYKKGGKFRILKK